MLTMLYLTPLSSGGEVLLDIQVLFAWLVRQAATFSANVTVTRLFHLPPYAWNHFRSVTQERLILTSIFKVLCNYHTELFTTTNSDAVLCVSSHQIHKTQCPKWYLLENECNGVVLRLRSGRQSYGTANVSLGKLPFTLNWLLARAVFQVENAVKFKKQNSPTGIF